VVSKQYTPVLPVTPRNNQRHETTQPVAPCLYALSDHLPEYRVRIAEGSLAGQYLDNSDVVGQALWWIRT